MQPGGRPGPGRRPGRPRGGRQLDPPPETTFQVSRRSAWLRGPCSHLVLSPTNPQPHTGRAGAKPRRSPARLTHQNPVPDQAGRCLTPGWHRPRRCAPKPWGRAEGLSRSAHPLWSPRTLCTKEAGSKLDRDPPGFLLPQRGLWRAPAGAEPGQPAGPALLGGLELSFPLAASSPMSSQCCLFANRTQTPRPQTLCRPGRLLTSVPADSARPAAGGTQDEKSAVCLSVGPSSGSIHADVCAFHAS